MEIDTLRLRLAEQKGGVRHVLGIGAAYHFCQEEVKDVGPTQSQVVQSRRMDGDKVFLPLGPKDHLILSEKMSHIETRRCQFLIRGFQGVPKGGVFIKRISLRERENDVDVHRKADLFRGMIEAEGQRRAPVENER